MKLDVAPRLKGPWRVLTRVASSAGLVWTREERAGGHGGGREPPGVERQVAGPHGSMSVEGRGPVGVGGTAGLFHRPATRSGSS